MKLTNFIPVRWQDLQNKVAEILTGCNFKTEVFKTIVSVRGKVEIDVYAEDTISIPNSIYIIECKNWNTKVPQEKIHAFNTVVQNIGANHGLVISKSGFQPGAFEASKNTNLMLLSYSEFQELFKMRWVNGKLRYLQVLSEPLFEFTDYFSRKYNKQFYALNDTEKEQFRKLIVYGNAVVRCSSSLINNMESLDHEIKQKTELFNKDYESYEEYFDDIESRCLEGIEKYKKLLSL